MAAGRAVDPAIVHADQDAVPGQPDIALHPVRAVVECASVGSESVFGFDRRRPAMSDHFGARSHTSL